jgi:hypothetical protein
MSRNKTNPSHVWGRGVAAFYAEENVVAVRLSYQRGGNG